MSDKFFLILDRFLLLRWKLVFVLFILGLGLRSLIFMGAHQEGDERIYMTLVEQLDSGRGYTLQGSSLLSDPLMDYVGYDRPLFFHPPGGAALNWLFFKLFGYQGFPLVQIFAYTVFFWSMMLLARGLKFSPAGVGFALTAALSAFTPIMAHVTTKFWLDGPLLAFTTLAAALYVWGVVNDRLHLVFFAGLLLGYASLIKMTAFLVVPALLCLTWSLSSRPKWKLYFQFTAVFLVTACIIQVPWEIYQWHLLGSPFPGWAGKPSAALIESNPYIYLVTVANSPWVYFTMTPLIVWTLSPACILYLVLWKRSSSKSIGLSFLVWIFTVLLIHVALGYIGYSKVIRYVILISPAVILLFSMVMDEVVERLRSGDLIFAHKIALTALLMLASVSFLLEIFSGIYASIFFDKVFS